jgi:hypothetical protein
MNTSPERKIASYNDSYNKCNIKWNSIDKINAPDESNENWMTQPDGTYYIKLKGKKISFSSPRKSNIDSVDFSTSCEKDKNGVGCTIGISLISPAQHCVCEIDDCVSYCQKYPYDDMCST